VTIIEVDITPAMVAEAERLAAELPVLNHSIREGEGTVYGFLGEVVFRKGVGGRQANTYDYDIVMKSGVTVDVKTKMVRSMPRPHYECSVTAGHTGQDCDVYAFVRVLEDMTCGWYCGVIAKAAFFEQARLVRAGEQDGDNGWIATVDCYNLPISDLG
jgi:hypothetical protein